MLRERFGRSWAPPGRSWRVLGGPGGPWEDLGESLGGSWGIHGRSWRVLGGSWRTLGRVLGGPWGLLVRTWGVPEGRGGSCRGSWSGPGGILEGSSGSWVMPNTYICWEFVRFSVCLEQVHFFVFFFVPLPSECFSSILRVFWLFSTIFRSTLLSIFYTESGLDACDRR